MSSQAEVAPLKKTEGLGVDVPSLMAHSRRQASATHAPTRERVSEAIALVRARQANTMKKSTVTKVNEMSELKNLRGNVSSTKIQLAKSHAQSLSGMSSNNRSPLAPAGQTSSVDVTAQKQSQLQQPSLSAEFEPYTPTLSDEPEENNAPQLRGSSSFLMNPLDLIKREFQLATQSASQGNMQPAATEKRDDSDLSFDKKDSNDSEEPEVDPKTMQDVGRYLDEMNTKKNPLNAKQGRSPEDAIVVEQVSSTLSDPIQAMRSEDLTYGSDDDENSSTGSVNPETLAEISAFIDSVSKTGSVAPTKVSTGLGAASAGIKSEAAIAAHIDALHGVSRTLVPTISESRSEADFASNFESVGDAKTEAEIATYIDSLNGVKTETEIASHIDAVHGVKSEAEISSIIDAVNGVRSPEDIESHIDAVSGFKPDEKVTAIGKAAQDSTPEEAEKVEFTSEAPITTCDSLDAPLGIEADLQDLSPEEIPEQASGPIQLDPPVSSTSPVDDVVLKSRGKEVLAPAYSVESLESKQYVVDAPFVNDEHKSEEVRSTQVVKTHASPKRIAGEREEIPDLTVQESVEVELDLEAYIQAGDAAEDSLLDNLGVDSNGSSLGVHWAADPPEQEAVEDDTSAEVDAVEQEENADYDILLRQAFGSAEENTEVDLEGKLPELQEPATDDEADDIVMELKSTGLPACPSMTDDESLPWDLKNIASEETMKATGRTKPSVRSKARQLRSLFSDDSSVQNSTVCSIEDECDQFSEADVTGEDAARQEASESTKSAPETPLQTPGDEDESIPKKTTHVLQVFDPFAPKVEVDDAVVSDMEKDGDDDDAFVQAFLLQGSRTEEEAQEAMARSEQQPHQPRDLLLSTSSGQSDKYSSIRGVSDPPANGPVGKGFLEQFDLLGFDDETQDCIPVDGFAVNDKGEPVDLSEQARDSKSSAIHEPRHHDLSTFAGISEYFACLHNESSSSSKKSERISNFQKLVAPISAGNKPTVIEAAQIRQAAMQAGLSMEVVDRFLEMTEDEQRLPAVPSFKSDVSVGAENDVLGLDDTEALDEDDAIHAFLSRKARPPTDLTTLAGIAQHFSYLHEDCDKTDQSLIKKIKKFQKLVKPVGDGEKPTVIEAAGIRQAAQRARVSLELVDKFLAYTQATAAPELPDVLSSKSERSMAAPRVDVDNMEDVNEDEEIEAFLTRFGTLHKGGHFPDANVSAVEDFINKGSQEEEAVEFDATYGFVDKKLEVSQSEEEDGEQEWWKEGQQQKQRADSLSSDESDGAFGKQIDADLVELGAEDTKPHQLPTPKTSSKGGRKSHGRREREEFLLINTKFSKSHDENDDGDWQRKSAMAKYGAGWQSHANWLSPRTLAGYGKPRSIDSVEAAENLKYVVYSKKLFKNYYPWRQLYKQRTRLHSGFLHVDVNSVYDSTAPVPPSEEEEEFIPWERRRVLQRFLHEKSYAFSRNWFGDMVQKNGNEKIKQPVCKPKSMEMPIENIPDPGEWTEEWYKQWKSPYDGRAPPGRSNSDDDYTNDGSYNSGAFTDGGRSRESGSSVNDESSYYSGSESETSRRFTDDDDYSWEEAPECGEIINVKQKIGERVSRVHPDYTSSLRRSRWRKKYFPRGTFPY